MARRTLLVVAGALASCGTLPQSTTSAVFTRRYGDFTYADVEAVRQTTQKSCGLAALACVLRYWEKPVTEPELVTKYPLESGAGHSLQRLQAIAVEHGVLAFAVSMNGADGPPNVQLARHLAKGRPVVVALLCPEGRYLGEPVPVLGTLDARSIRPFGIVPTTSGKEKKHHYVVVIGQDATRYLVMDPAYGIGTVNQRSLLDWWQDEGYAALVCAQ
jgi:predicted double-glycine peptidase